MTINIVNLNTQKENMINNILQHKRGFLINVGKERSQAFELFSTYYYRCLRLGNWLSFDNYNPTKDEHGNLTQPIEGMGELSIDTDKIASIYKLDDQERKDLFEFDVSTAYRIMLFSSTGDVCIGFME